MTIYILHAYPNAHKWTPDSWVIGYFTSKRALRKAIKVHVDELNIYNEREFYRALDIDDFGIVNDYAETGMIEKVTANEF